MHFGPFFEKFGQNRIFLVTWDIPENQFGRLKKQVDKIFDFLWKSAPPSKNS